MDCLGLPEIWILYSTDCFLPIVYYYANIRNDKVPRRAIKIGFHNVVVVYARMCVCVFACSSSRLFNFGLMDYTWLEAKFNFVFLLFRLFFLLINMNQKRMYGISVKIT